MERRAPGLDIPPPRLKPPEAVVCSAQRLRGGPPTQKRAAAPLLGERNSAFVQAAAQNRGVESHGHEPSVRCSKRKNEIEELNRLGREGWEAVAMVSSWGVGWRLVHPFVLLKRPRPNDAEASPG